MRADTLVDEAAKKAAFLVGRESRGPGDTENAMRRIEARYGIPYGALWGLRYRKPRDMLVSIFVKIAEAYQAECARQQRLLDHELSTARRTGLGAVAVSAARAFAGAEDKGKLNDA